MPCCEISDRAQMSKTIIAVRHFALGGRESLETAVIRFYLPQLFLHNCFAELPSFMMYFLYCTEFYNNCNINKVLFSLHCHECQDSTIKTF